MTINSPNDSLERRTMLSEILNVLAFVDVTVPRNVDDDIGTVDNALIEGYLSERLQACSDDEISAISRLIVAIGVLDKEYYFSLFGELKIELASNLGKSINAIIASVYEGFPGIGTNRVLENAHWSAISVSSIQ